MYLTRAKTHNLLFTQASNPNYWTDINDFRQVNKKLQKSSKLPVFWEQKKKKKKKKKKILVFK